MAGLARPRKGAYSAPMSVLLIDLGSGSPDDREQNLLLARVLRRAGRHDVLLACPEGSVLAAQAGEADVPVVELAGRKSELGLWWTLNRIARERRVRLIHTLDAGGCLAGALLRNRHRELRLVHTVRAEPIRRRKVRDWCARQADALVFVGAETADRMGTDKTQTPFPLCRVIPPAARLPFAADAVGFSSVGTSSYGLRRRGEDGRFIFVASGELTPATDMGALLQAMAYLQTMSIELPPWEVRIVGEGPLFADLLDSAEKLGVQARLSLLGGLDRRCFLSDADAVVCCSASGEGDASVLLDAWMYSLPVACTALPVHQAIGEDKVSALFSPPANPVALAGSMLRLMQDPALRVRLGQGGCAALERFRPERMGEAYVALYDELLGAVPGGIAG